MLFRTIHLLIALSLGLSTPAFASNDAPEDPPKATLPIEVAFIYSKKKAEAPDFKDIALKSPVYLNAPEFAKNVLLAQEEQRLEALYNKLTDQSAIVVFDDFKIKEFNRKPRWERTDYYDDLGTFVFDGFDFNKHYVYEHNDDIYALFIKNIADYEFLPIKYEASNAISTAFTYNNTVAAELTLKPDVVDDKPFVLDDGREANLILANIVDVKLILYNSGEIFYHEVAAEWKPKSRIDKIINDLITKE